MEALSKIISTNRINKTDHKQHRRNSQSQKYSTGKKKKDKKNTGLTLLNKNESEKGTVIDISI